MGSASIWKSDFTRFRVTTRVGIYSLLDKRLPRRCLSEPNPKVEWSQ
jgi:hypothetical protein